MTTKDNMMPAKGNSRMFNSKQEHDQAQGVVAGETCNLDGQEVPLGTKKCVNHDSYKCGKNGWYKDGGTC